MIKKFLISFIIAPLINGCNNEINTVTPQASSSISSSKESGFLLSIAKKINNGELDIVDSVWTEQVWRYEITNGQKKKVALSTNNQVVLRLKETNKEFKKDNYFLEWKIEEKKYGDLASGNGVFMVRYPKDDEKDTLHFLLRKTHSDSAIDIGTFLLIK